MDLLSPKDLDSLIEFAEKYFGDPRLGRIRRGMATLGIKATQLAEVYPCSVSWVCRVVDGKVRVSDDVLRRVEDALLEAGKRRVLEKLKGGEAKARGGSHWPCRE